MHLCTDNLWIASQNMQSSAQAVSGYMGAEILCWGLYVYWCILTGVAVLRDALATVQGEMKDEVI